MAAVGGILGWGGEALGCTLGWCSAVGCWGMGVVAEVLVCVGLWGLLRVGIVVESVVSDGLRGLLGYYTE